MGKRGKIITEEVKRYICERYVMGERLANISKNADVSQTTIMQVLRERGVPLKNGETTTPINSHAIVSLYTVGKPIKEVSSITGASPATIYRVLKENGVKSNRMTQK